MTTSDMKNVLIVSAYYPPGPTACAHRARFLAKHLGAAGWRTSVLCVDERDLEEKLDYDLVKLTSPDADIIKCRAIPARFVRRFGLGEVTLRSRWSMRSTLRQQLTRRRFDVVLFTGSHFYSMLLAPEVKRRFGVPVVLDFQDPWVSAWGATQPRWSKAGISHRLAKKLEPTVVKVADFITSVSDNQNADMAARYPWLDRNRMAAIPIGGDPEDYDRLRSMSPVKSTFRLDASFFNISYVGTIWPAVLDTVRAVLRAAAFVRGQEPKLYSRLRLNFVGTTPNPNDPAGLWVRDLAEAAGVSDVVRELPERLPYLEALSIQARSDAIMALGSQEPHYTASKIYGVLMSGRPYLSVFHEESSAHDILKRTGGGISLAIPTTNGLRGMDQQIATAIVALASIGNGVGQFDHAAYAPYEAKAIAAQYAQIFDRLVR